MIDRKEFNRLLDAYTSTYAQAVVACSARAEDYDELVKASLKAREEFERAVLGERP